jgi:hypothetical protein
MRIHVLQHDFDYENTNSYEAREELDSDRPSKAVVSTSFKLRSCGR